jgi:hypothetical protein
MTQNQYLSTFTQLIPSSPGTAGQVLTSAGSGSAAYWGSAAGGGGGVGYTGSAGAGYTGSAGTVGYTGSASTTVGYTGSASTVTGYTGSASGGYTGSAGSVGYTGSSGSGSSSSTVTPAFNFSSQFNGSSYFSVPNSSAFAFGTGAFTIEFWINAPSNNDKFILGGRSAVGTMHITTGGYSSTAGSFRYNGSSTITTGSTLITDNSWHHCAVVRDGSNNITLYIDGVSRGTGTDTTNYTTTTGTWYVGVHDTTFNSNYLTGFISNLRIVKGTAVYTSAFTPPTSPLSAITNTTLLTCTAITPSDISSYNAVITNSGVGSTATLSPFTSTTVSIPTQSLTAVRQQFVGDGSTTTFAVAGGYTPNAISVFVNGVLLRNGTEVTVTNGSTIVFAIAPLSGALIDVIGTVPTTYSSITPVSYSVGFNGSTQYLSAACSSATNVGTGNFTMELWFNLTNTTNTGALGPGLVATQAQDSTFSTIYMNGTTPNLWLNNGASLTSGTAIVLSTWNHIAIVRSGTTLSMYLNGVSVASTTNSSAINWGNLYLGVQKPATGGWIAGYISNFRFVNGAAVYTNNFTVPSSPLAITQSASGAFIQAITGTQTSLLTCNGPTIIDGSTNAFTITNNGSAPVSTAIVPTFTNVSINNNNTINFADGTTIGTAQSLSSRNKIINGAMIFDQRNFNATPSQTITAGAALTYIIDRWYAYCTGANVTGQRVAGSTSVSQYNFQFTGASSVTGIGFGQRIEASNCYDLAGTTATLSILLSNSLLTTVTWTAYYATTADTFGTLASPTRTQIATGTFTVNSTLTRYSTNISIPLAATTGIEIVFSVGAQTSGTWTIGNVQLEAGAVATPFERRSIGTELALCQRYYQYIPLVSMSVQSTATGNAMQWRGYGPVYMRTNGTVSHDLTNANYTATGVAGPTNGWGFVQQYVTWISKSGTLTNITPYAEDNYILFQLAGATFSAQPQYIATSGISSVAKISAEL